MPCAEEKQKVLKNTALFARSGRHLLIKTEKALQRIFQPSY